MEKQIEEYYGSYLHHFEHVLELVKSDLDFLDIKTRRATVKFVRAHKLTIELVSGVSISVEGIQKIGVEDSPKESRNYYSLAFTAYVKFKQVIDRNWSSDSSRCAILLFFSFAT